MNRHPYRPAVIGKSDISVVLILIGELTRGCHQILGGSMRHKIPFIAICCGTPLLCMRSNSIESTARCKSSCIFVHISTGAKRSHRPRRSVPQTNVKARPDSNYLSFELLIGLQHQFLLQVTQLRNCPNRKCGCVNR